MNDKKFIIVMLPGPIYHPEKQLSNRLRSLSRQFSGALITTSNATSSLEIGNFRVLTRRLHGAAILRIFYSIRSALSVARSRHAKDAGLSLIVSYDPLATGIASWVVSKILRVPLVVEVNGDYSDPLNYADTPSRLVRGVKRKAYSTIAGFVLKRADGIKLLHPAQLEPYGLNEKNKRVLCAANHVDIDAFSNKGDSETILTAGFPIIRKGTDILIEAFKIIHPEFPTWTLDIIGYFPDPTKLNVLIGGHPGIRVLRPVHHEEMPSIVGNCGLFVLPSRSEAMGRVLVEAMAAGKARIGSRVGGIPTVIEDGIDGILVPPDDPKALAAALRRLLSNTGLRASMGERGAKRANNDFSPEKYVDNIGSFYRAVISGDK